MGSWILSFCIAVAGGAAFVGLVLAPGWVTLAAAGALTLAAVTYAVHGLLTYR